MIRLWKLGSLEHKVAPTKEAVATLAKILKDHRDNGGDNLDLIWGPDIEVLLLSDYPDEPITDVIQIIRPKEQDDAENKA